MILDESEAESPVSPQRLYLDQPSLIEMKKNNNNTKMNSTNKNNFSVEATTVVNEAVGSSSSAASPSRLPKIFQIQRMN